MEPFVLQPNHLPALDHVPMGLCVLDEDLTVLVWNALLEEWTGISKKGILGKPIDEFFPHLGKKPYRGRLGQIFEGGTPTIFSSQLHKQFLPSKLPGYKDQVQHTTVTALPLEFADGYHALVAIRDVTETTNRIRSYSRLREEALKEIQERKRIEEELKRQERRSRSKATGGMPSIEPWKNGTAVGLSTSFSWTCRCRSWMATRRQGCCERLVTKSRSLH